MTSREAVDATTHPVCGGLRIGTARKAVLRLNERIIRHDQDTVHRAPLAVHDVDQTSARVSYSGDGAKGNTTMESLFGRSKPEDLRLFHMAAHSRGLERVIARQPGYYCRQHSTLGETAPIDYGVHEEIVSETALGVALQRT